MKFKWLLKKEWWLILVVILMMPVTVFGQSDIQRIVVAQFPEDGNITFIAIHADGTTTPLGELPSEFRLPDYQQFSENDLLLTVPESIAVSPDQQYAAISAGQGESHKLYVYRTDGEHVWTTEVETAVQMSWSPDNQGFAFTTDVYAYDQKEIGIAYFDLETGQVKQLIEPEQVFAPIELEWINDQTLSLIKRYPTALITVTRDGKVTELPHPHDHDGMRSYGTICETEWSEASQRFFVVTGCASGADSPGLEELFVVDLEGTVELILSAPDSYRDPNVDNAYYDITGVEIYNDIIYAVVSEFRRTHIDDEQGGTVEKDSGWRILRWRHGEWQTITSGISLKNFGKHPRISPNGRYLALGEYGYTIDLTSPNMLIVVDLVTGDTIRQSETPSEFNGSLIWFDHYRFLYSDSRYSNAYAMMTSLVQIIDLSRPPIDGLIQYLDAPIWLP